MEWKTSYILVRPRPDGACEIVHAAEKIKDSRYWLQYIAQPGDAIFVTPRNPQYKGDGEPTFSANLLKRGKIEHDELQWRVQNNCGQPGANIRFVEPDTTQANRSTKAPTERTDYRQLADKTPRHLSLQQLSEIFRDYSTDLEVILAEAGKWIDWESALTLMTQDIYVIEIEPNSKWPLRVTLRPESDRGQTMNYESEMKFLVRHRPGTS